MSKGITASGVEYTVTHIMKDGTIRDTMEGFVLPVTECTKVAYQIMANVAMRTINERQKQILQKN